MISAAVGPQRLRSQCLAGARCRTPAEVVRRLGALQAQAYGQVLWAIGLRTQRATRAEVEGAIAERRIVLTWPLRGTLHAVPAEDARWMLTLSAPRTLRAARGRLGQLGLDDATIARSADLFRAALAGGKRLTRPALLQLLSHAGVDPAGQRGYHLLWHAAQSGLVCLGPVEGAQQTFVLLEEWVPGARALPREDALAELARRYFHGHGPATVHDFAWWAGLTLAEARAGLAAAQSHLQEARVGGTDYWLSADGGEAPDDPALYLLPGFDEYILGYKERRDVLAPEHAPFIVPGNNGVFQPAIVAGGRVVGTWAARRTRAGLGLTLRPFVPLLAGQEAILAAADRYGAFAGAPIASVEEMSVTGPAAADA